MKIGIITSGFEMIGLFKFLNKYDFQYHIFWDWNNGPYQDKDFDFGIDKINKGIDFLFDKVDYIIIPPIYELYLNIEDKLEKNKVIPLFYNYLFKHCLRYSLVGKIGFVGDYVDISNIKPFFKTLTKNYKLNTNQQNIKKFNFPFAIRCKQTSLRKAFLPSISNRSFTISKIIKFDLRYFKDASVDTIIPLNYGYFWFERLIKSKLNLNKIRFHGINQLQNTFESMIKPNGKNYSITFYKNGTLDFLLQNKKWLWLLQRGQQIKIQVKEDL